MPPIWSAGPADTRLDATEHPAAPIRREKLCTLARPWLDHPLESAGFEFHEAAVVMVEQGTMLIDTGGGPVTASALQPLWLVQAGVRARVGKYPQEPGQPFRSVFLTLAPALLERHRAETVQAQAPPMFFDLQPVPPDLDLLNCIHHVHAGIMQQGLSDARASLRLLELLQALQERGYGFRPPGPPTITARLRELLEADPAHPWTAPQAARALAMSEATLRRRLAREGQRFDPLLASLRMQYGLMLLQTTRWSLPLIAQACGYRSPERFARRFVGRFGHSPGAVRRHRPASAVSSEATP